jgi:putative ABC transport system permease protein
MNITQAFKSAWKSIISNKLRSFLTMLGMIIGVSSVIILTGLVQGATNFILSTFMNIGTDVIEVNAYGTETRYLTVDGMYKFVEENQDLYKEVSPVIFSNYTVKKDSESKQFSVLGVAPNFMGMTNLPITSGRFIKYAEIKYKDNCCVVGKDIVKDLFDGKDPVGESLKINGQTFKVIGVHNSYSLNYLYIPYTSACKLNGSNRVSTFEITVRNTDNVTPAVDALKGYLYSVMKDKDLYYVQTMKQFLDIINTVKTILSTALGGIAGISLLVAGIGIMNIMLVSVVERTKEIGIRKALGAKKKDIIRQFVIEAASISTLGGLTGILFGVLVTNLLGGLIGSMTANSLGNVGSFSASPSLSSIILAFSVSTGIGIIFGFMPAKKAANLNPIDALRSE